MLQMIYGRAASGKTTRLFEHIERDVRAGEKVFLFVPEQFSYETERAILHRLGDRLAASVSVLTFTRLCDEVERLTGGMCGTYLNDSAKPILMNRALKSAAPEMKLWNRYVNSAGFAARLLEAVEEFKINAVTPEDLEEAALRAEDSSFSLKISETALVFRHYEALVGERFIDPTDRATRIYERLETFPFFADRHVYFDSFKSFTGQQLRIISRIFSQTPFLTFCFTNDPKTSRRYDLFENIRSTAERIRRMAGQHRVAVAPDEICPGNHYRYPGIAAVEELLAKGRTEPTETDGSVNICRAATVYDEAEFAARTIRRLVRTQNYRFRDFVIIARDSTSYEEAVLNACRRNGVACFTDKRVPLGDYPPAVATLAAISAAQTLSTESVLRFQKSGIGTLDADEIATLENYTCLWNINGKAWLDDWTMDPKGLVFSEEQTEIPEEINALRRRCMAPIVQLRRDFSENAERMAAAIVTLLETCGAKESLAEMTDYFQQNGRRDDADALRQSWDQFMKLLNDLTVCYGKEPCTPREFTDSLKTAVSLSDIGVAPQMLDEVTFGAADRIRPSRPKIAFVLGANQGVFPAVPSVSGLFGIREREKFIELGIEISDHSLCDSIEEDFLVYTNLCCATDRVYICYSVLDGDHKERTPSSFVTLIAEHTGCRHYEEPDLSVQRALPETADAVFSEYCSRLPADPSSAELLAALDGKNTYLNRAKAVANGTLSPDQRLSPETAEKLFGRRIRMSASRFDEYHRCKFQYFCRNGLKAKRLQPADFDVMQRGTLVHYCLQCLIEEYGKKVAGLDETGVSKAIDRYVKTYLEHIRGYQTVETPHLRFLTENISRSVKEVALQIAHEFAQSQFEPVRCELKFGLDGAPAVEFPFDGGELLLNGSIDRVDQWNGYVRIIDYKSGKRNFRLPDILFGQNLQMLLYLYAALRQGEYQGQKPAGIFYMPASRSRDEKSLAMNGLMPDDADLVHAMEPENAGVYIPKYRLTKSGTLDQHCAASFVPPEGFDEIFAHIERLLKHTGEDLLAGKISIDPVDGRDSKACKYCDFAAVCGQADAEHPRVPKLSNDEVLTEIGKGETGDDI